jgi:predicted transposase YdaD
MMTSEQRLDRLERIAMLMVRVGARVRREQNEKIHIIIDAQIRNEDRFATLAENLARSHNELAASIAQSHNELSQSLNELAKAQTQTENRLDSLIEIITRDRNGNSG